LGLPTFSVFYPGKMTRSGVSEPVMTGVTKGRPSLKAVVDAMSVFLAGSPVYG
jgi:hypothetical protein